MRKFFKNKFGRMLTFGIILILALSVLTSCEREEPVSIKKAYINDDGELVLRYSDGEEDNLGVVVGEDGKDGADGKDGKDGENGKDGADGKDAVITVSNEGSNIAYATSKGLQSAVSIFCESDENSSAGSGVIYKLDKTSGDAFIITNYHVVYDSKSKTNKGICSKIQVFLYGGELLEQGITAEYVGGSDYYDIAVLRIEDGELLKNSDVCEVKVADSDKTLVGEPAIAIGNAKGMGLASSYGVVSVDSEHITMNSEKDNAAVSFRVMRVDTAVNPGNSGGGLFNENGELIGIVNAKIIDSSVEGIGYAIPSNVAVAVADNIIDNCFEKDCKSVQRCMMGVMITISNSRAEFDSQTGRVTLKEDVVVHEITEGSMVKGILEVGDIIKGIAVGDKSLEVTRQHQVIDFMLNVRVGDSVTLTVQRNGEIVNKTLEITEAYITAY